jgi:diaminopimelate decarboxylase
VSKQAKISGRPPAFVYRNRELHCESASLTRLAEQYGTPLYVYSGTTIQDRFRTFDAAFKPIPHTVCYSVKANSNLTILRTLASLGAGFDVVSGGELERVLHVNRKAASRVVFSGVGKTAAEMDLALRSGILLFNLESEAELEVLAERASGLRKTARIAFRVNPDVLAKTHPYITTGMREHKFGVPIHDARRLYSLAAQYDWLEPAGISVHIGSQITEVSPFRKTMERVVKLADELMQDGLNIVFIDAGGGLGIDYDSMGTAHPFTRTVRDYANALLTPLHKKPFHLLLEPGRSIIAPAGALVTRVVYVKENSGKRFLVTDAGMNDLIRPSLYHAHHEIVPVHDWPKAKLAKFDVVGPICETGDFFARDRQLPEVAQGELIAIMDTGAYGMSISSNYNTRPRIAELLVKGKNARVIRRREKFEDMIATEI